MEKEKKNQFHPETIEKSKQASITRELEIKQRTERTINAGKKCLSNPDFVQYRENYEKLEALMVESWLNLSEPDPIKYTVISRGMAMKLHQLRLLLNGVKSNAGEK